MERGEPRLTIVALPCEDDVVNRYSSEEVAHMTIMVLPMPDDNTLKRILTYVAHAANTSLCKFWMDVKGRGELGENKADVLFLHGYESQKIKEFRDYLLANPDIRKLYDSVEQYDKWLPHVTMGYPEKPAKPDTREYPGIHSISFDRIAVWTGEYSGFEIQLDDNYSLDGSVRMSDVMARGEAVLAHYGILGMHWGVRKDRVKKGTTTRRSGDASDADKARAKARTHGTGSLSNKELKALINRNNLEGQYSRIHRDSRVINRGHEHVKTVMAFAGTAGAVYTFYQSPLGKAAVRRGVQVAGWLGKRLARV